MAQTKEALEQVPGVAWVRAAIEIANGFVMVRNIATGVALVLIGTDPSAGWYSPRVWP